MRLQTASTDQPGRGTPVGARRFLICGSLAVIAIPLMAASSCDTSTSSSSNANSTTSPGGGGTSPGGGGSTSTPVPVRKVTGTATTLGAGSFPGGKDVAVGLYDVTGGSGQSGNFIVTGTDSYDEILGSAGGAGGVPKVRVQISTGDQIQISGLSTVVFTPVTAPFVTTHTTTTLYAGTFTVGQDVGSGRYVATPGTGQSGNFIVSGTDSYDEILGSAGGAGGVPNVSVTLSDGDIISISGLSQVTLTASS